MIFENLPIELPEGWQASKDNYGTLIETTRALGPSFVTISENRRNYRLGYNPVFGKGNYSGRGWRERLYHDAVEALKAAIG